MIYDERIIDHIIEKRKVQNIPITKLLLWGRWFLSNKFFAALITLCEKILGFLLTLPIPIYSDLILFVITYLPGSPRFLGNYLRGIYYSKKLKYMGKNVIIDEGVIILHPANTEIHDFTWIDRRAFLGAYGICIGKRVHICPYVCVLGRGKFVAEDYAGVSYNAQIITSSEVPKEGARTSGPMAPISQRNVMVGDVILKKDAFVGAGTIVLPGVTINEGAFIGAFHVVHKSTPPWKIRFFDFSSIVREKDREKVKYPDPD